MLLANPIRVRDGDPDCPHTGYWHIVTYDDLVVERCVDCGRIDFGVHVFDPPQPWPFVREDTGDDLTTTHAKPIVAYWQKTTKRDEIPALDPETGAN